MAEMGQRTSRARSRESGKVLFIGEVQETFSGTFLPNTQETLQVFFYHHKFLNKTVKESARDTADLVTPLWTEKSRIPIVRIDKIIEKLRKLYHEWILITKNHTR